MGISIDDMEAVSVEHDGFYINNKKLFLFGINYHPSEYGLDYYKEYADGDERVKGIIARDFKKMHEFGLNSARVFIRLEDFLSERKQRSLELFDSFVSEAEKNAVYIIPCFYGHMSGDNTPKFKGSFYSEDNTERMLSVMEEIVERYENRNIVLFWDPSNEPIHREVPSSHEAAYDWTKTVYDSLRAKTDKKIILGEGGSSRHKGANNRGFHLEELAGLTGNDSCLDGFAVHDYRWERWTRFKLKLYENLGKPVFLEESGSTTFSLWPEGAEKEQAEKLRVFSYSSLLSKNSGVMPWCWQDFSCSRKPYSYIPRETGFGLHDLKGKEKPAAKDYRKFMEFVNHTRPFEYSSKARMAVLLPRGAYDSSLNPNFSEDPDKLERQCFEIFALASKAHYDCDIIRETSELEEYDLILLPDAKVSEGFAKKLEYFISNGKIILSFGVKDGISKIRTSERVATLSDIELDGETISSSFHGTYYEPDNVAEQWGSFGETPLGAIENVGEGNLISLFCPLDRYFTDFRSLGQEHKLIEKAALLAGIEKEFDVKSENIDLGVLEKDGKRMIILVNHSRKEIKDTLKNTDRVKLREYGGKEHDNDIEIKMGPRGVKIFYET